MISEHEMLVKVHDATSEFVEAWKGFVETLPGDYGCSMRCIEAETLAHLFQVMGYLEIGDRIIENHAPSDEPGDDHYRSLT